MLNLFLKKAPFLRFSVPLICGVFFAETLNDYLYLSLFVVAVLTILFLIVRRWIRNKASYKFRFLTGTVGFLIILTFGFSYYQLRQPMVIDRDSASDLKVQIIQSIGETERNYKYEACLKGVANDSLLGYLNCTGLIYLPKTKENTHVKAGDTFLTRGQFIPFSNQLDLFGFDYCGYLRNQRISFRFIVKEFEDTNDNSSFNITVASAKLKEYFQARFCEFGLAKNEMAILNALYLGDKSQLTYEQKDAFSDAGAMHLLAVSGLHVGIIYLLLLLLVQLLGFKKNNLFAVVLVILALWFYALMTGFAPSVLRASIMFTIIELGRMSRLKASVFNLLGASVFIIILIDPLSVFNVGFWLSHVAVASIVSFYPKINSWFYFSFPPFRIMWSIVAVSLSAQIGTFPIIIYVFNEFPLYFLLANLLLIPVVTPILIVTVLASVFSYYSIVLRLLIPALGEALSFMEQATVWINTLPYTTLRNLSIDWWLLPFFYLSIALFLVWLEYRYIKYCRNFLVVSIIFLALLHLDISFRPREVLFVANIKGKSAVNYFNSDENVIYSCSPLSDKEIEFAFGGVWAYGHAPSDYVVVVIENNVDSKPIALNIGDEQILILPSGVRWSEQLDWLGAIDKTIIMNRPSMTLEEIRKSFRIKELVIPNEWAWYHKKQWLEGADKYVNHIHIVKKDGALFVGSK